MSANKKALTLAGLLMTRGGYSYERSIPKGQVSGLKLLSELKAIVPVSYTHLTLPTKRIV